MKATSSNPTKLLLEFLRKYPKQFFALFALLLFEGLVAGLAILAVVPLTTYLIDPDFTRSGRIARIFKDVVTSVGLSSSFWTYGFIFVGINLVKGIVDIGIRHATLNIKYTVVRGLLQDVLRTFFKARWEFFGSADQGKLLSTLNKEIEVIGSALGAIAQMLAQVIQFGIYMAIPLSLNPRLTILSGCLAIVFGLPFLLLQKRSYSLGKQNVETASSAMGILVESLAAARIIIGFGRQNEARQRYLSALDRHIDVALRSQTLGHVIPNIYRPLGMLAGILAIGLSMQNRDQVAELAAVMWSILSALPILSAILQGQVGIKSFMPSYEQLIYLQNEALRVEEVIGSKIFSKLSEGVRLQNLDFEYPGRKGTLQSVDVEIKAGQMTALVGESGSGKSTISDLILGLQIPMSGKVLIDGKSLDSFNQNSFREKIGYVPQDPILFQGSIRDNLIWSLPTASEQEMWQALKLSNAEKFVRQLPLQLDTIVGDRGMRLSGGQRQRIALARAMIRRPELLILDEATSALDAESEASIQKAIDDLAHKTTILVIAHRLSTIAKADKIYVLQSGKVAENGSFQALANKEQGLFAQMVQVQRGHHARDLAATSVSL